MTTPETRYGLVAASVVRALLDEDSHALVDTIRSVPSPQQLVVTLAQSVAGNFWHEAREAEPEATHEQLKAAALAAVDRDIALMLGTPPDAPEDV